MRILQKFILRNIAGEYILVPLVNKGDKFNGVITLNETGVFIWKQLEKNETRENIVLNILNEYDVEYETAKTNVDKFLLDLYKLGIIE